MWKTTVIAILLIASTNTGAQTDDKRVAEIRQMHERTDQQIAEAEKNFPESEVFFTELVVNRGGTMYPAVGHFKETVRFYYTYGSRKISPYPNRILKIKVATERSASRESAEYFFNSSGRLIFASLSDGEVEHRFYFEAGMLVRGLKGSEVIARGSRGTAAAVKEVVVESERLLKIFRASVE